jgi:regulator of RNase E activity RraA
VMPGDIVFGDLDGVCVIPRAAENEVFRKALEKVRKENLVGQAIQDGMSTQEAFKKFDVM